MNSGRLTDHARKCWSNEAVDAVKNSKDRESASELIKKYGKKSQKALTSFLKKPASWAKTFSNRPPSERATR